MGQVLSQTLDFKSEEQWLRKIQSEDEAGPKIFLGSCLARQGRLREALSVHRQATEFPLDKANCPDEAWLNIGLILRSQEDFEGAKQAAKRGLDLSPNDLECRDLMDDVVSAMQMLPLHHDEFAFDFHELRKDRKMARALVTIRKHLERLPYFLNYHEFYVDLLIDLRRFDDAQNHIDEMSSESFRLGFERSLDEEWEGEEWQSSLGSAEEQVAEYLNVLAANLAFRKGDLERAEVAFEKAIDICPVRNWCRMDFADCLKVQAKVGEQLEVLLESSKPDCRYSRWWAFAAPGGGSVGEWPEGLY